jgi:hypothetical protein
MTGRGATAGLGAGAGAAAGGGGGTSGASAGGGAGGGGGTSWALAGTSHTAAKIAAEIGAAQTFLTRRNRKTPPQAAFLSDDR